MIEVYIYTHNKSTVNDDLLQMETNTVTRGHRYKLKKRSYRTSLRHNLFSFRVVDTWNNLPVSVVTAPSLNAFKALSDKVWSKYQFDTDIKFPLLPDKLKDKDIIRDEEQDQLKGI